MKNDHMEHQVLSLADLDVEELEQRFETAFIPFEAIAKDCDNKCTNKCSVKNTCSGQCVVKTVK